MMFSFLLGACLPPPHCTLPAAADVRLDSSWTPLQPLLGLLHRRRQMQAPFYQNWSSPTLCPCLVPWPKGLGFEFSRSEIRPGPGPSAPEDDFLPALGLSIGCVACFGAVPTVQTGGQYFSRGKFGGGISFFRCQMRPLFAVWPSPSMKRLAPRGNSPPAGQSVLSVTGG